jgi:hypothetical protein
LILLWLLIDERTQSNNALVTRHDALQRWVGQEVLRSETGRYVEAIVLEVVAMLLVRLQANDRTPVLFCQ